MPLDNLESSITDKLRRTLVPGTSISAPQELHRTVLPAWAIPTGMVSLHRVHGRAKEGIETNACVGQRLGSYDRPVDVRYSISLQNDRKALRTLEALRGKV